MTIIYWWWWYRYNEEGKTVPYDYLTQSEKSDGHQWWIVFIEYDGEDPNDEYDDKSDSQNPNDEDDDESDGQDPKCKMAASQPRPQKS